MKDRGYNMNKKEKVGNITLDLEVYSGQDLYSDGEIEDTLLEIVKNNTEDTIASKVSQTKDWAILYHLSTLRQNIIEWVPIQKNETVLEIGSGCGAITGVLADKAKQVTCIELSKKRSLINAYRNKEKDNIEILVGNFKDIKLEKQFDYVTLIGVFEYAASYIEEDNPYEKFLEEISRYLKKDGKLIVAIENRFGLKYWAGCKEDHTGRYFDSIEGYKQDSGVNTFSKNELQDMFMKKDFTNVKFYYPYPDYKFPQVIFSDDYLPKQGDLRSNGINFDAERMTLFNEDMVFDNLIKDNMFTWFSNSFLIIGQRNKNNE